MSKAAQLKRKASEFEQKKQYDRALATYVQAVEAAAGIPDEIDIPLYNRVGDLYLRLGDLDQAVAYYEMAVDLYAEGGFFNNAIALCNKVLRHSPSRSSVYYKLGKISAKKGFNSDAKQNFLEYADRMQKAGDVDEAFRALKEFADLCSGQDDVRLMLADQLTRVGRSEEALEQLQIVYDTMIAEDRTTEAAATLERMRALDPTVEPKRGKVQPQEKRDGLVFIDVNYQAPPDDIVHVADDVALTIPADDALDDPASDIRPKTTAEFDAVELPAPADAPVRGTLGDSPLAGLEPRQDPFAELTAITPVDIIEPFDASMLTPSESILDEPTMFHGDSLETASLLESMEPVESLLEPQPDLHPSDESLELLPDLLPSEGLLELPADVPTEKLANLEPDLPAQLAEVKSEESVGREDDYFVDLQSWLLETEPPKNPRMTTESEVQEEGTTQTDFTGLLETFKRGIAENVEENDIASHYDLGVAYMEMGLTDDAIAQFQRVIRGDTSPEERVRAYESLGQCFIELQQYAVVIASLTRALEETRLNDDKLVGVLFLLGYASEAEGLWREAHGYYQRVFAVDIHFRDVGDRLRRADARMKGTI